MADGQNSAARDELASIVERIVRLEEQKAELAADIRDIKAEAKSRGFDVKAVAQIVREKRETIEQRRKRAETEEIADVYRAALGMLDGTPLGESARKRLDEPTSEKGDGLPLGDAQPPDTPRPPPASTIGPEELAAAREQGRKARREFVRIIDNPFTAGDPRRAAWDEGWCSEAGSDGMDIPDSWKRREEKKQAEKEEGGDA